MEAASFGGPGSGGCCSSGLSLGMCSQLAQLLQPLQLIPVLVGVSVEKRSVLERLHRSANVHHEVLSDFLKRPPWPGAGHVEDCMAVDLRNRTSSGDVAVMHSMFHIRRVRWGSIH